MMSDEPVNAAIDEIARQTTQTPPGDADDFRRRVLARIAANDAPRRSWRAAFVLSPLGIAAAIVIALLVARGFQPRVRGPERAAPQEAVRLKPDTTEAPGPKEPALRIAAKTVRPKSDTTYAADSRPAPQLEPIEMDSIAPAPLVVRMLAPDPIPIERIEAVTPVTIAPLEIITDLQRRQE